MEAVAEAEAGMECEAEDEVFEPIARVQCCFLDRGGSDTMSSREAQSPNPPVLVMRNG